MSEELFDVYFSGKLLPNQDPAKARTLVAKLFKASEKQLAALFSGKPVAVKRQVNLDTASKYRLIFRQAGALVDIRPSTPATPAPAATSAPATRPETAAGASGGLTLSPANTGSLVDCAPELVPEPIPDTGHIGLLDLGNNLEDPRETPELEVDLSGLSVTEGGDWQLNDCPQEPLNKPVPAPRQTVDFALDEPTDGNVRAR